MTYVRDVFLAKRYNVARQTIWDWAKTKPGFPQPVKLSERCTRFKLDDAEAWETAQCEPAE